MTVLVQIVTCTERGRGVSVTTPQPEIVVTLSIRFGILEDMFM
jgi:hypothetical protein